MMVSVICLFINVVDVCDWYICGYSDWVVLMVKSFVG